MVECAVLQAQIDKITAALTGNTFLLQAEKAMQGDIENAFKNSFISYEREVRLDDANIIDFKCGRIGVEVKIKGVPHKIIDQLARYAKFDELDAIILFSGKAIGLPPTIAGKPVSVVSIGEGWI